MKAFLFKILKLFKKDSALKFILQVFLMAGIIAWFVFFLSQDLTGGIFETIVGFLLSSIFIYFLRAFYSRFEDVLKINYDTEEIIKMYPQGKNYRKTLTRNGTCATFAYADSFINKNHKIEVVDDPNSIFTPDDFVMQNYEKLFSAHTGSAKINGETIRLDKFTCKDGICTIHLGRSTYFNHLITNRAMDFEIFEDITLRQVYEYGPTISSFEKSKMSNHIGINALVFLKDGNLLVPRRKNDSTISKNKITSSIAVKLNYPTDGRQTVNSEHLVYGNIIDNLSTRTKISPEDLELSQIEVIFLGFGQNLYEGGKPQFYYAVHLKNIDTETYKKLTAGNNQAGKLDMDKCIYVADYDSFQFKKNFICFKTIEKNGKIKKRTLGYEMSYLCNIWHYEEYLKCNTEEKSLIHT